MKRFFFTVFMAWVLCAVLIEGRAFGAEEGFGHYIPGALADFMDIAPEPGLAVLDWYNHYNGSIGAGRQLEFGGVVAANASATSDAEMAGAIWTFPCGICGGRFSTGILVPYVWMNVTGSVSGPSGRTISRTDAADGLGDILLIPFWLSWNRGDFKWGVQLDVYAPTGGYNAGSLANPGLNYWTFEPMVSFSYLSKTSGLEISTTAGFDFNTENDATNYQSGEVFHLDATVAEHLPLCKLGLFGAGVNAFYWKQFTADSGTGALLGSFETLMTGVGPVVSYVSPKFCGNHTVVAEVKWLPQIETSRTLKGDYVWFKAAVSF